MSRNISWGGILSDSCEDGAVIKLLTVGLNLAADTVVHRYVCLSVCLSVTVGLNLAADTVVHRYVCLSVCLSVTVGLNLAADTVVHRYVCLSVCLSVCDHGVEPRG